MDAYSASSRCCPSLVAELGARPDARVLDVRGAGEFAAGHVAGATHAAYTRLAEKLDLVAADLEWLVHCGSGVRAAMAAAFLVRHGRRVTYVNGAFGDISEGLKG